MTWCRVGSSPATAARSATASSADVTGDYQSADSTMQN